MEATATNREGDPPIDPAPAAPGVPRGRRGRPRWIALAGGLASLVAILGWFELTSYRQVIGLVLDEQAPEAPAGPGPQASIATGGERAAEPAEESRSEPGVRRERRPLAAQRTVELDRFEARLRSCRHRLAAKAAAQLRLSLSREDRLRHELVSFGTGPWSWSEFRDS